MILLIDNYDSFTYNLVQRIGELAPDPRNAPRNAEALDLRVVRNDKITAAEAAAMKPDFIVISPGPCTPRQGGVSNDIIQALAGRVPILGVCLGHQCIGHCFGMTVGRNYRLMHGKTSLIHHDNKTIFAGMSNPFTATRYHSLVIYKETFDEQRFEVSAWTDEDEIMGLRLRPGALAPGPGAGAGRDAPLEGVQFHPESFLTVEGHRLLANFLGMAVPEHLGVGGGPA
ncbi:MAG: aminodeoxychorismate/anthranilate synthase component II [Phycisphaeraceae bacterium]